MKLNQEKLDILRKIDSKKVRSQRQIAKELELSLGKINYCLKELKNKGLLKVKNFAKNPNKSDYIYVLTPKGISEKTKLTINFMKRKMEEYDRIKEDLKNKSK